MVDFLLAKWPLERGVPAEESDIDNRYYEPGAFGHSHLYFSTILIHIRWALFGGFAFRWRGLPAHFVIG